LTSANVLMTWLYLIRLESTVSYVKRHSTQTKVGLSLLNNVMINLGLHLAQQSRTGVIMLKHCYGIELGLKVRTRVPSRSYNL